MPVNMLDIASNMASPAIQGLAAHLGDDEEFFQENDPFTPAAEVQSSPTKNRFASVIRVIRDVIDSKGIFTTIAECPMQEITSNDDLHSDVGGTMIAYVTSIWANKYKDNLQLVADLRYEYEEAVRNGEEELDSDYVDDEIFLEMRATDYLYRILHLT